MSHELRLDNKTRAYLDWLILGGFKITPMKSPLNIKGPPPWKKKEFPLDGDIDRQYQITENIQEAVKQAVYTANRSVFLIENAEAEKKRAELHAARVVVKSIQASLKRKLEALKEIGGPGSAFKIATTEAFLNETARDYQDLSKIIWEDENEQHQKNAERGG